MRGQASLETLVVAAVFIAILGLWLVGVNTAKGTIESAFHLQQERATALSIAKAINTVCAMGPGNSLTLDIYLPVNATLSYNGNLTLGNQTHPVYCSFDGLPLPAGRHSLAIENSGGKIRLQGV